MQRRTHPAAHVGGDIGEEDRTAPDGEGKIEDVGGVRHPGGAVGGTVVLVESEDDRFP